jgi:hypothetical protein
MAEIDVQALYLKWNATVLKQVEEMKIRQWCVEQAIKIMAVQADNDTLTLADDIYSFVTTSFGKEFVYPVDRSTRVGTSDGAPSKDLVDGA